MGRLRTEAIGPGVGQSDVALAWGAPRDAGAVAQTLRNSASVSRPSAGRSILPAFS